MIKTRKSKLINKQSKISLNQKNNSEDSLHVSNKVNSEADSFVIGLKQKQMGLQVLRQTIKVNNELLCNAVKSIFITYLNIGLGICIMFML